MDINFEFKLVSDLPNRKYIKKSKYDSIIDKFLNSKDSIWQVNIDGVESNYLWTQINKRLKKRNLGDTLSVSVVNNLLYIEKK